LDVARIGFHEGYTPYKGGFYPHHCAVWSPSGLKIAANSWEPDKSMPQYSNVVMIAEPGTGRTWRHRGINWDGFCAWADSTAFVTRGLYKPMYIADAETGAVLDTPPYPDRELQNFSYTSFFTRATTTADVGPYICGTMAYNADYYVMTLRKNLTPGKMIWKDSSEPYRVWGPPQIDPSGEWVAWTHFSWREGGLGIALKRVKAPSYLPPDIITPGYKIVFCDWTDDGNLLVNISEKYPTWQLAIMNKKGQILRRLATPVPPAQYSTATWRRYGHQ
jgi:hypothetical protein